MDLFEMLDTEGKTLKVGMTVTVDNDNMWYGTVVKITEPDGDVDDEGRAIALGPHVYVQGTLPEPWEDRFHGRWLATGPWDDDNPQYQCDDVKIVEEGTHGTA